MPESQVAFVAVVVPPRQSVPPESICKVPAVPAVIVRLSWLNTPLAIHRLLPESLSVVIFAPAFTTVAPEFIFKMCTVVAAENTVGVPDALVIFTVASPSVNVPTFVNNVPEIPFSVISRPDPELPASSVPPVAIFKNPVVRS